MIREPTVADMFYPSDPEELVQQIKECFNHKKGPKNKKITDAQKTKAVISPHAGYAYSGAAMAWSYQAIKQAKKSDVYVILGTNHQSPKTSISTQNFQTPLGITKNDDEFTQSLIKKGILEDNTTHQHEHSIEVQIPFLQYINKEAKIIPILIGYDYEGIAEKITKTAKELNKKIMIIISTDFTHYGKSYGYLPFIKNVKEKMYKLDKKTIQLICKLDEKGFEKHILETETTICGQNAIKTGIKTLKLIGIKKGELLQYYTSADIIGEYSNAVGYGSIRFL